VNAKADARPLTLFLRRKDFPAAWRQSTRNTLDHGIHRLFCVWHRSKMQLPRAQCVNPYISMRSSRGAGNYPQYAAVAQKLIPF
jgi:hypothetical protein